MFEKSLTDLIQGLRANKRNEAQYIQTSLEEIQSEVQMSDTQYKSAAIDKLNYLHMLGYDMNWANFNIVEVMASSRFNEKRAGYLAATQSFHQETDVLMLTTNLIRKDLASSNAMEVSVALDGLAQIVTPEQAADLFEDVLAILGHPRPYIRKKALVCLYRLVLRYPEGLHEFVPRLKDALDDPDPSVVSSAVSVICELSRTNPHNYMPLAPKLYHLLNSSTNNWMRIKIVKLFASLTPIEPRLAKKLHGPLSQLIKVTTAMSLLYECIHTAVVGDVISVPIPVTDNIGREIDFAELCAQNLVRFYESKDHNLCYVGLVTLAHLQAKRPDLVVDQYDIIIGCLDYPDLSIRMRALEVITGMTTRRTLTTSVKRLMSQLILSNTVALQPSNTTNGGLGNGTRAAGSDDDASLSIDSLGTSLVSAQGSFVSPRRSRKLDADPADSPEYRTAIVDSILDMCSRNSYSNMTNFEWYVATLVDLVYVSGVDVGHKLSERLLDVTVRVRQVREYSVKMARRLLSDKNIVEYITCKSPNAKVLSTAAYILGEYSSLLPASSDDIGLLLPPSLSRLNGEQQAMFIQAAMKVYTNWLHDVSGYWNNEMWELVRSVTSATVSTLSTLVFSCADVEATKATAAGSMPMHVLLAAIPLQASVRLRQFFEITKAVSVATSNPSDSAPRICVELHSLFTTYELNPVSAAAQSKVPVPEGLDLDQPVGDPIPDRSRIVMPPSPKPQPRSRRRSTHRDDKNSKSREDRKNDPFYLGGDGADGVNARDLIDLPDVDDIPVVALDLSMEKPATKADKKSKKSKSKKSGRPEKKTHKSRVRSPSPPPVSVDIVGDEDMPAGAAVDDHEQLPTVAATQQT
ncbi:AP-3 complex subunit delta [Coemansia sp. RSA 485]|nr:AP-3 complex subunit delta [Coemansia sp. RSA 485]